jgi:hypothetical protein
LFWGVEKMYPKIGLILIRQKRAALGGFYGLYCLTKILCEGAGVLCFWLFLFFIPPVKRPPVLVVAWPGPAPNLCMFSTIAAFTGHFFNGSPTKGS